MRPDKKGDYEVGYGKPPRHTRFKRGRSGNPRGRHPGSRNLSTVLSEALNEGGEEFMDHRLLASIDAHRAKAPQAMLDALLADVRAFCGQATPNDDVTMVVVRYDG